MSNKNQTVYNLENEAVIIKIDANSKDCKCFDGSTNQKEGSIAAPKQALTQQLNKQHVYHEQTPQGSFQLPFQNNRKKSSNRSNSLSTKTSEQNPHESFQLPFQNNRKKSSNRSNSLSTKVYPVSITVEKIEKDNRESKSPAWSIVSEPSKKSSSLKSGPPLTMFDVASKDISVNLYDHEEFNSKSSRSSSSGSSRTTKSSKSNKSAKENDKIPIIPEEQRLSLYEFEENVHSTPFHSIDKSDDDRSVSNIEIAHYPFKYSDNYENSKMNSYSLGSSSPRNSDSQKIPFVSENPAVMRVSSINEGKELISADSSESTLSVQNINPPPAGALQPREHGPHCAIEVNILEKHQEGCANRRDIIGKSIDDKVGSYDVVSRTVYRTCNGNKNIRSSIKNSAKGFHLNTPEMFGVDLQEKRSRVETMPILPNYKCVLNAEVPTVQNPFENIKNERLGSEESAAERSKDLPNFIGSQPPPEVLSVYIRTDRTEQVPPGFQKMHYRGDSCKLHDPEQRTKQILQLQQVIEETSSEAFLNKSHKQFSVDSPHVFSAAATTLTNPVPILAPVEHEIMVDVSDPDNVAEEESAEQLDQRKEEQEDEGEYYDDEDDDLPPHLRNDEDSTVMVNRTGLFNCFRRNKHKKQREESIEYVRDISGKRVTHSSNQPKMHYESGQRKSSIQYQKKR